MISCAICKEQLCFVAGKGWLHPDGNLYKVTTDTDGIKRDDHCAMPDFSEAEKEDV